MSTILDDQEILRYNRQIILKDFDFEGQERLKTASIMVIGLGGLGCTATQYLAAAGVGHFTLIDFDTVSVSNLHRQILHNDARVGMAKVESAAIALRNINPAVKLSLNNGALAEQQFAKIIDQHDLVLDCTDNVDSRNQLNRLCYQYKKPLLSAAAIRMEGQISLFTYQPNEPCYRCLSQLFAANPLTCVESGVMAPLVAIMGSIQAMEAIKTLTNYGKNLRGRLLLVDAMTMQFNEVKLPRNPKCEICGNAAS